MIEHAVSLYHCFSLGPHDVETIPAARGTVVGYESIRKWGLLSAHNRVQLRRYCPAADQHYADRDRLSYLARGTDVVFIA